MCFGFCDILIVINNLAGRRSANPNINGMKFGHPTPGGLETDFFPFFSALF
jgi:hypothetical protein